MYRKPWVALLRGKTGQRYARGCAQAMTRTDDVNRSGVGRHESGGDPEPQAGSRDGRLVALASERSPAELPLIVRRYSDSLVGHP
jgi:hypothetical protein